MIKFEVEQEGYNKAQVDGCIEQIEIEYQKLYLENQELHSKLEQVQQQLEQTWKIITDAKKGLPTARDTENTSGAETALDPHEQKNTVNASEEEPVEINANVEDPKKPQSRAGRLLSNIAFYGALAMLLIVVFAYTQSGTSRSIFGYSYYNILTTSMQSTLPQGSFILVKETPGEELQVGDDITYFKNANTIVTHRIIEIYENYEDSGQYGFRTQGTDNPSPDAYVTYEGNVIGKVVYHIPVLGFVLEYIANNIWMVVIGFALILALAYFLKIVFTPEKPKEQKQKKQESR